MTAPEIVVRPDAGALARAVAEELVARLAAAQATHGSASVVLTGGGVGIAVLEQVAALAGRRRLDGGRRVVGRRAVRPRGRRRPQRGRRPPRPARRRGRAARSGCTRCRRRTARSPSPRTRPPGTPASSPPPQRRASDLPRFDVLLLGIGPEGHTASIFPESPAAQDERPVFAVRDCPKPPPTRVSLGFSAINSADEVWLVVAGEEKAAAPSRWLPAGAHAPGGAARCRRPGVGTAGTGERLRVDRPSTLAAADGDLPRRQRAARAGLPPAAGPGGRRQADSSRTESSARPLASPWRYPGARPGSWATDRRGRRPRRRDQAPRRRCSRVRASSSSASPSASLRRSRT